MADDKVQLNMASLEGLESNLRDALRREAMDPVRQQRALEIQKEAWGRHTSSTPLGMPTDLNRDDSARMNDKELMAKEEEIKRKTAEVGERVKVQAERVMQEAKKLEQLKKELETIEDPTKKEVADLRKRIEAVDKELRPMKALCERKERELKDALTTYNDKNAQKAELVGKLFEIVTESEKMRLKKLDEINMLLRDMECRGNNA